MSLLTKKQQSGGLGGFRDQAMSAARQAGPAVRNASSAAAQQAGPMAKSAGTSMKQGAASRLEQSAIAISENLAPMIAGALLEASRKIDYVPPKQRRSGKNILFVGSMLLLAGSAAAAYVAMQRQENNAGYSTTVPAEEDGLPPVDGNGQSIV